jgi:S-adenosylmethionine-diacylglycerol 3-amino-3-carboxypropyl transferase
VNGTRAREVSAAPAESEAACHADFESILRYAQCWEDADILLEGLDVQPGQVCISIASAGDNSLSLLTRDPGRVVAVDLNPAQLAALELRVAAYRTLDHGELLELVGSRPSARRASLYARCRVALGPDARRYWDARTAAVEAGVGSAGKFERYFAIFRRFVLPLVHRRARVAELLVSRSPDARRAWYAERWDTPAWRGLFRLFFSRRMLGALGRDPSFFRYVEGSVAEHLLRRVRHGLAELDPSRNPYARWILTGMHGDVLPHALRVEHFATIRDRLDRLEWHRASIESLAERGVLGAFDRANLSDIFEYMSPDNAARILHSLADVARPGARLAYWNMMVPRRASDLLPERFRRLEALSRRLFEQDKAFFYRDFVVEEVNADV